MRRNFRGPGIGIAFAVLAPVVLVLLPGCGGDDDPRPNQPPIVTFTQRPVEGATVTGDVTVRWSGRDPDGEVRRYETSLDSETEWTETADSSRVLAFTRADGSDSNPQLHVFRVRAVDDRGLRGESIAASFTVAVFNDPPAVVITRAPATDGYAGAVIDLAWSGTDPDGSVARFDHALQDTTDNWTATTDTSLTIDFSSGDPVFPAPRRGARGPLNTPTEYTFFVRAVDDEGKASAPASTVFLAGPENVAPTVTLLGGPPLPPGVVERSATWTWEASDPDGALLRVQYAISQAPPTRWTRWDSSSLTVTFDREDGTAENPEPWTFHLRAQDDDSTFSAVVSRDFLVGVPNQAPTVSLTQFPDPATPVSYRFTYKWQGQDDEGVAFYEFAVDDTVDGSGGSLWQQTTATERTIVFEATEPDPGTCNLGLGFCQATSPHVFHLRAVDGLGLRSAVRSSPMIAFTLTPATTIETPLPAADGVVGSTEFTVEWRGRDFDASSDLLAYDLLVREVDSFDEFPEAADAVSGDGLAWEATGVTGQNGGNIVDLESGKRYIVAVRARDEAGATDSVWSYTRNVLKVEVP